MTESRVAQGAVRGLGQIAYDKLVEALEDGILTADSRIVEDDIGNWLGMSRTPVREALLRLQSEGVLVQEKRKGLTIARLDHDKIVELYQVREVLEGAAASFAAQHASEAEIMFLRELSASEHEVAGDPVLGARFNRRLHQSIYRATHNSYLLRSLSSLTTSLALLGNFTRHVSGRAEQAGHEHAEIIAAIASRDAARAEATARAHIRSAQQARLKDIASISR